MKKRFLLRGPFLWSILAAFVAGMAFPSAAAASFSLITGPSEKTDEVAAAPAPAAVFPGAVPAGVKALADREFQTTLEREIAAARSEITLSAYSFSAKETFANRPRAVADRLGEAAGRGVKVEVILEIGRESEAVTRANREAARLLARRGVKVFVDNTGTTVHARFVVIDRRLVFIGSHDLTENSLGKYREVSLLADSPPLAEALLAQAASLNPAPYVEAPQRRAVKRPARSRPSRRR